MADFATFWPFNPMFRDIKLKFEKDIQFNGSY